MNERKTLFLIDGSSYIYRAYHAVQRLTNAQGMATNAVFGFLQMLTKVLRDHQPDYVCVVFDPPGPTTRHELYPEYKATRQAMPEDLVVQVPYIKELVRLNGVPQLELQGYEADDIIATLASAARGREVDVMIVSGDKDLHQLIEDPRVRQWDPQRDRLFDEREVKERFGVEPQQMVDLQALMGDSSDNVPGVPKIGQKRAKTLLSEWGTLDELLAHVDEVKPPSVAASLRENRDLALLSRQLVTLDREVPVDSRLDRLTPSEVLRDELIDLYRQLDFRQALEALAPEAGDRDRPEAPDAPPKPHRTDRIITTREQLRGLIAELEGCDRFCIDLETTSTDPMSARLVGVAVSFADHAAAYIPCGHTGPGSERQLRLEEVLAELGPLLSGPQPEKIGQNIKYEWVVLERHRVALRGIGFDTMVANYLLDPGGRSHRLERLAEEHLGEKMITYTDVTGKGKDQVSFAAVEVGRAAEYSCEDAETTWRLAGILSDKLREEGLEDLYRKLELPLIEVLARMERRGIVVDRDQLEGLALDLEKSMDQMAGKIYEFAGSEFNIQSPKQLGEVLFDRLGLPVVRKTKTGPSTDMNVLEVLAAEHPIAEQVLGYRSLAKLKGTYAEALPKLIHPDTGRIHTSYHQAVTATGRLSSSEPNLQNIPIRTEEGRKIRAAFIPAPGCVLLSADYSQIELRILAHYSGDEHLVTAFHEHADVHRRTAAEMFGIPPQAVTPEMRRQAKTINFGIIYGMGAFGLARQLRISNKLAKSAIERYFERYRGVRKYVDQVVEETSKRGYCETLMGRRRAIPELQSRNRNVRQQGERLAMNTPIQGTAADIIKKAMIDIDGALRESVLGSAMLLQVHDELIFEVPEAELEAVKELVRDKMENAWPLDVPLEVDMGWGDNWASAHP